MTTKIISNVYPIRARERDYTVRLHGTVSEFQAAYVTSEQALYWEQQSDQSLFRHVMKSRDMDHDPEDGTPVEAILPVRYDVPSLFDGVMLNDCNLDVEDEHGRIVYKADLSDESEQWRHTRSQFHHNAYNLVGKGNAGRLVINLQYEDCLTYRFQMRGKFDPDLLTLGWSFIPSDRYYSSVQYDGVGLEAEMGGGRYTFQSVDLFYRNQDGQMRSKHHSIGELPWQPEDQLAA